MRLGVLDVGSCSAHLYLVDVRADGTFRPAGAVKAPTHLGDVVRADGTIGPRGIEQLVAAVKKTARAAREHRVEELVAFGTAVIRDAPDRDRACSRLEQRAGVRLAFFSGEEEARLTYLAARHRHGDQGPLLVLDIGGGSMEIAYGESDGEADRVWSLDLGARRLTQTHLPRHPARPAELDRLEQHVRRLLLPVAAGLGPIPADATALATSRTFEQLARLTQPKRRGDPSVLDGALLLPEIARLAALSPGKRAGLRGISRPRARQILAGAVVAHAAMDVLGLPRVRLCPWALREGVILRHIAAGPRPGVVGL